MKKFFCIKILIAVVILSATGFAWSETFSERFAKGTYSFGVHGGAGYTFDLPSDEDRVDLKFVYLFPTFQYNLTGVIGDSWYRGSLYWHNELGLAYLFNHTGKYLVGFSPLMLNYKFVNPKRSWAPNILGGAGFSQTNWKDIAVRELGSKFQFLLHLGGGLEFFRESWSYSLNYRFFHVSNSGIKKPNIGVNAHVFTIGLQF